MSGWGRQRTFRVWNPGHVVGRLCGVYMGVWVSAAGFLRALSRGRVRAFCAKRGRQIEIVNWTEQLGLGNVARTLCLSMYILQ